LAAFTGTRRAVRVRRIPVVTGLTAFARARGSISERNVSVKLSLPTLICGRPTIVGSPHPI
jgi:hypothetical protein